MKTRKGVCYYEMQIARLHFEDDGLFLLKNLNYKKGT